MLAIYVLIMLGFAYINHTEAPDGNLGVGFVFPFIIFTPILIWICYKKGESPKWQWGKSKQDHPYVGVDAIILNDKGEILLEKRAQGMSTFPGYWAIPGGWMEWGETVEQAVKREVQEELGIEVEVVKFIGKYFDTNTFPIKKYSRVALPHICKIVSGEPTAYQKEEVEEVKWVSPQNALDLEIAYDHKEMIRYAIDNGLI